MTTPAFQLDDIRQRADFFMNLTTMAAAGGCGVGLAFVMLGLFAGGPGDLRALIIGLVAFMVGGGVGLWGLDRFSTAWQARLRGQIRENLTDRGLLLVTMQDEACERLPSLKLSPGLAAEKLAGSADTGSFEWRLRRLAGTYASCCKDLGLPPYPTAFELARLGTFGTAMIFLMLKSGLGMILKESPVMGILEPVAIGMFLICMSAFVVMIGSVRLSVIEEIVAALGKHE